jgi:hypothetical protein
LADDDGGRLFPSVAYLVWLLDSDRRTIQRKLSTLRELRILAVVANECGGRGHRTHYQFNEAQLPARETWLDVKRASPAPLLDRPVKGRQLSCERASLVSRKGGILSTKGRHQCRPDQLEEINSDQSDRKRSALPVQKSNRCAPWQSDHNNSGNGYRAPNRLLDAIQNVDHAMGHDRLSFSEAISRMRRAPEFADRCAGDDFLAIVLSYFREKRGLRISGAA